MTFAGTSTTNMIARPDWLLTVRTNKGWAAPLSAIFAGDRTTGNLQNKHDYQRCVKS